MVISQQSYGRTNQMTGPIDMLLQTVALALVGHWWPAIGRCAGQQGSL
jgi:hypothetical protein